MYHVYYTSPIKWLHEHSNSTLVFWQMDFSSPVGQRRRTCMGCCATEVLLLLLLLLLSLLFILLLLILLFYGHSSCRCLLLFIYFTKHRNNKVKFLSTKWRDLRKKGTRNISLRPSLILSSHLRVGIHKSIFLVGLFVKILKALLHSFVLIIRPAHLNLLDLVF